MDVQIIRVSKEDGSEEPVDTFTALRRLRDAYPGFSGDQEIIEILVSGTPLQTDFAIYKLAQS